MTSHLGLLDGSVRHYGLNVDVNNSTKGPCELLLANLVIIPKVCLRKTQVA